ncbi:GIY-YIG nuclease family protein [uncultured Porphyromonas sp.]|uniref:GIY-YIG nuclease family protein n=1 Tax=uncultured Porphyromonas sp. TaxID=159274 RepID=UPI0026268FCA|nr:GIY-YIG nuclease family protein [uncultured Porphyromonas sp.]
MSKTINITLVDNTPQGVQVLTIANRICQAYVVPRKCLPWLTAQPDALMGKSVLYILLQSLPKGSPQKPQAYIGQTDDIMKRAKDHDSRKAFWDRIILFCASNDEITSTEVEYFEHKAITEALQIEHYDLNENKQIPKGKKIPTHRRAPADDFFEDVKMLLAIIGCDILDEGSDKACTSLDTNTPTFYIKGKDADAAGRYSGGKFTVLKGSVFSCTEAPSYTSKGKGERKQFIEEHCTVVSGLLRLKEDYTFNSPSTAAKYVLGCNANGWITWKNEKGQPLTDVHPRK